VQSQKSGPRPDTRNRSHRSPHSDNRAPRNHREVAEASKVSPLQVAARVANLRMLLEKSGGDIPTFAGRAEVSLAALREILEGQKVVGDERATHIELTLELGQGWLDKQHQLSDITQTTVDILLGKDVSTFEKEIRISEQKGHEIMKNAASTASTATSPSTATPAAAASKTATAQTTGSDKASSEVVEARLANLTLLTQGRGAKSRLAQLLGVSAGIISFLFSRSKEFTNSFTRNLESVLVLPELWMDTARDVSDVPQATWEKLGSSADLSAQSSEKKSRKNASAKGGNATAEKSDGANAQGNDPVVKANTPEEAPRGHRVHRMPKKGDAAPQQGAPQPALQRTLQLRTSAAPSVLLDDAAGAGQQPELNLTPAASTPAEGLPMSDAQGAANPTGQANESAPEDAVVGGAIAPVAQPPAEPAPATAAAKAASPATAQKPEAPAPATAAGDSSAAIPPVPAGEAPAAQGAALQLVSRTPAQLTAEAANSRPDVLQLSSLFLSPITEALLKTLTIKAQQGLFSEKDAYRLLGQISEM
jgi:hypothetical protein